MNEFTVVVDGPQVSAFRAALGTATVPVDAPTPRWVLDGSQEIFGYRVDMSQLSGEQRRRLNGHRIIPAGDAWSWGNLGALKAQTQAARAARMEVAWRDCTRPACQPPSPWCVMESSHTDLAVITRDKPLEPEAFETVDVRTIAGLQHAIAAAEARARDAELQALAAEGRAEAQRHGQLAAVAWMVVLGVTLTCGLVVML